MKTGVDSIYIPDEEQMLRAGQILAPQLTPWLQAEPPTATPPGALVFLHGDLGAGKTTLVRGLLRAYGVSGAVRSPTYTLIEPYEVAVGPSQRRLYHLDLYRLADPEELEYLGWQELLADGGLLLIEWPERGAGWLPAPDLRLSITMQPPGRTLKLSGHGAWQAVALKTLFELEKPSANVRKLDNFQVYC